MGASANTAERVRYSIFFCFRPLSRYDASILSFHISRQRAYYSHHINIHTHFRHSFSPFLFVITQNYDYSILHGLDYLVYGGAKFRASQCSWGCVGYLRAWEAQWWEV